MIEKYKHFIPVDVFRPADGKDCTLGGASSKWNELYLVHPGVEDKEILAYCAEELESPERFFRVLERDVFGKTYRCLVPCINPYGYHYMFGSNLAYASDSRFREFSFSEYPLTIHDRHEPATL